jgi:N utilization substance protein B
MLSLFIELHERAENQLSLSSKKYLKNNTDSYPNKEKFLSNKLLLQIAGNKTLKDELSKRKLNNWYLNEEYIRIIYNEVMESEIYAKYMSNADSTYEEDKRLIIDLFRDIIAPNEKIYDYFEDDKLTWVDDIPIVNTFLLKQFKKVKESTVPSYFLPPLFKDEDDMVYANRLLTKTLLNNSKLEQEIEGKTPNWDKDRIADIDAILLKMAICELLNFPSIPERVTINEFLEIAKEYSTPKSSIFINGILDKLVREYKEEGKLKKVGRGLL